jgi:hypothetical protein
MVGTGGAAGLDASHQSLGFPGKMPARRDSDLVAADVVAAGVLAADVVAAGVVVSEVVAEAWDVVETPLASTALPSSWRNGLVALRALDETGAAFAACCAGVKEWGITIIRFFLAYS